MEVRVLNANGIEHVLQQIYGVPGVDEWRPVIERAALR